MYKNGFCDVMVKTREVVRSLYRRVLKASSAKDDLRLAIPTTDYIHETLQTTLLTQIFNWKDAGHSYFNAVSCWLVTSLILHCEPSPFAKRVPA